jgi:hypothetical protein
LTVFNAIQPVRKRFFMRGPFITALFGAFVVSLLSSGCGDKDNPASAQTTDPVGTWKSTVSGAAMTLVANADKSYTMTVPGTNGTIGTYTLSGTYTVTKDTIHFACATSVLDGEGTPCESDDGTISGNRLTMPIPYAYGPTTTLTRQ